MKRLLKIRRLVRAFIFIEKITLINAYLSALSDTPTFIPKFCGTLKRLPRQILFNCLLVLPLSAHTSTDSTNYLQNPIHFDISRNRNFHALRKRSLKLPIQHRCFRSSFSIFSAGNQIFLHMRRLSINSGFPNSTISNLL